MEKNNIDVRFQKWIDCAAKFYRTDNRYYHTIHHVNHLFNLFKDYEQSFNDEFKNDDVWYNDRGKQDLFCAIAFHDAYYMPGFVKNEEFSAEIADVMLYEFKSQLDLIQIKKIIISTVPGWTEIDNPLKKIMHDLDWSGFIDYDTMLANEKKILNEAVEVGRYDRQVVIANQYSFYKKYANADMYLTQTFSKFNDCVKHNLSRRMIELKQENNI